MSSSVVIGIILLCIILIAAFYYYNYGPVLGEFILNHGVVDEHNGLGAEYIKISPEDLARACKNTPGCGGFIYDPKSMNGQLRTLAIFSEKLAPAAWDTYILKH